MMPGLLLLIPMPMLMMLAPTLMILLDAFDVDAYDTTNDANADAQMKNEACHLADAYVVLLMPPLLPMPMLLSKLMFVTM